MTYFRTRIAYYHWRDFVSRSCSGWEGVVPKHYGRQAKLANEGDFKGFLKWFSFLEEGCFYDCRYLCNLCHL